MESGPPLLVLATRVDGGLLLIVAGLFFASILAHRYWRAKIRLEDELEAFRRDSGFTQARYREAWRRLGAAAAFVDRSNGLVIEVTRGWEAQGLPGAGSRIHSGDPALESAWKALPAPDAEGHAGPPREVVLRGRAFTATPLEGASLGIVLLSLDPGGSALPPGEPAP
jgi:hypothetical protein